ncbi:hypothetical protein F5887DRAFT_838895, partial [Amanita rubescens]
MLSCEFLHTISVSLARATGRSLPFGGINIIFAGDLAQLPPVAETRLSAYVDPSRASASDRFQRRVKGKILWLSISTVVLLEKINRQTGPENVRFVQLLTRLRTRVVSTANTVNQWNLGQDELTPIIVSDNTTKDRINSQLARAYAAKSGREVHEYIAVD